MPLTKDHLANVALCEIYRNDTYNFAKFDEHHIRTYLPARRLSITSTLPNTVICLVYLSCFVYALGRGKKNNLSCIKFK